jgi:hypothetical protein
MLENKDIRANLLQISPKKKMKLSKSFINPEPSSRKTSFLVPPDASVLGSIISKSHA